MINKQTKDTFIELANTRKFSETDLADLLNISVSSVRKLKKEFKTPDYDPNIVRNELKTKIKESKLKGTKLAFELKISYSLLYKLMQEIKSEKVVL